MLSLKKFMPGVARIPQDIVAVHLGHDGTYCARLRHNGHETALIAADRLPPINHDDGTRSLLLPKILQARYVAICLPGDDAVIKLLNLPGQLGDDAETQIRDNMGIGDADFRIGYRIINPGRHGRSETKVLTAGVPEPLAQAACALFPSGIPAPLSIEVDGLAAMTAFACGPGKQHADEAIGCIVSDEKVSFVAFFLKGELLLVRKFDFGNANLLVKVQQNLGVDRNTAQAILAGGSFDVSQIVKTVMEPFIKQLVISKHFIERRENCHVSKIFATHGAWVSREWLSEIKSGVGVDIDFWNPLEVVKVQPSALSSAVEPQSARLISALGAGLGLFTEKPS